MTVKPRLMTAEELLELPGNQRAQLVEGELHTMPPAGEEHGLTTMEIAVHLANYVRKNNLGRVYAAETGFKLTTHPDTVRAPDVAFVSRERLDKAPPTLGFREGAPDLAIEVVSPNDKYSELEEKVNTWLNHGTRLVIVLDARLKSAKVYRSPSNVRLLGEKDALEGDEVVPGWRLPLTELFAAL